MLRRQTWRWARAFAVTYPVLLAITLISGGQFYYSLGLVGFLFAAGCVPTVDWIARRVAPRRALIAGAVALNAAVALFMALPLLPVTVIGDTPIPAINQGIRDQIGWREYTRQVADVYHACRRRTRARRLW